MVGDSLNKRQAEAGVWRGIYAINIITERKIQNLCYKIREARKFCLSSYALFCLVKSCLTTGEKLLGDWPEEHFLFFQRHSGNRMY